VDILQIIVLSILQGITEFLPVSSSAHLILVPVLTAWEDQGLGFDIAVHAGTLLAVVVYFRNDLVQMATEWSRSLMTRQVTPAARLAWGVLLGTIPVGLAGITLKGFIEVHLRSPLLIAVGLIGFGILLGWADWRRRGELDVYSLTWLEPRDRELLSPLL